MGLQGHPPGTHLALGLSPATTPPSRVIQGVLFSAAPRERHEGKRNSGTSDRSGLSVPSFYRTKERPRENETGYGPERTEQIFETPAIQDGVGGSGSVSAPGGRLVSVPGPSGRILACPHPPPISPVPGVPGREGDVSIYQTPFRTLACPEGLHKASESGRRTLGGGRRLHTHVPGRLVDTFAHRGGCINQCLGGFKNLDGDGLQGKLGQIYPHPYTKTSLARDRVGHDQLLPVTGSRQRSSDTPLCQEGILLPNVLPPSVGGPVRLPQLRGPGPSTGPLETPTANARGQQEHPTLPARPSQAGTLNTPQLVTSLASARGPTPVSPMVPAPTSDNSSDGRLGPRVGLPVELGTSSVRGMVGREKVATYQPSGADSGKRMARTAPRNLLHERPLRYGQCDGSTVRAEARYGPIRSTPSPVGGHLRRGITQGHFSLGEVCSGPGERMGGRSIQVPGDIGGVATTSTSVRVALPPLRHPGGGPICLPEHDPAPPLPLLQPQNTRRRPGRLHGGLEPLEVCLHISSSSDNGPPEGGADPQVLQGSGPPDSSLLASSAVVRGANEVVPFSPSTRVSLPGQQPYRTSPSVTSTSRLEFLRGALGQLFSTEAVDKMLRAHRPSSVRQYESCWRRFQDFLRRHAIVTISASTVLDFLSWLADTTNRAPATISAHYAALADPLYFGMNITVPQRARNLLMKGIRASREPRRQPVLAWSLHRVLQYLTFEGTIMEEEHFLQRAVFLLALATGYRASQLAAITRHQSFSKLEEDCSALTLAPSPTFLAKNEQADDMIGPIRIPSFLEEGNPHPLCPVRAFQDYVERTEGVSEDHLFYNSKSRNPLTPRSLARLLCRVIEKADPGHAPHAHNIRGLAASLAFLRTHSVERVQDLGGWASATSFRTRYLYHSITPVPCVAMGTAPPLSSQEKGGKGRPRGRGRPRNR
ncbi:uncharacterized protein LOC143039577 [Oratosquilla oratoria]|uniref:uncharacterized protein LOC143039577 n=1 Tax=Oratosquilla oratoria TaxID=337810 RepID=UPI003F769269